MPPCEKSEITARSTLLSPSSAGPKCIVETHQVRPGRCVRRTLLPPSHRDLKVRVLNTSNQPITVQKNACIGNLSAVTVVESHAGENIRTSATPTSPRNESKDTAEIVNGLLRKLPDELPPSERDKVIGLLHEYNNLFSGGPLDMGSTHLIEHTIYTGTNPLIRQQLRRHPLAHLDAIDKQVDVLLQNDFVEPAASPWASNVVLVRKKDGSHRLYVNYTRVRFLLPYRHVPMLHGWHHVL